MTTANEALKKAANSNAARQTAETAKEIGEAVSDFAGDVTRKAGKQFARAKGMLTSGLPHVTLALAAGVGFLLGGLATS